MSPNVVCPHCGYVYTEGDEAFMPLSLTLANSFEEECVECHKTFKVRILVRAVYQTVKPEVPS